MVHKVLFSMIIPLLTSVLRAVSPRYLALLSSSLASLSSDGNSKWKQCINEKSGCTFYQHEASGATQDLAPVDEIVMDRETVQACVEQANAAGLRWHALVSTTPITIDLQAHVRGLLVRQIFQQRMLYLNGQGKAIILVQAHVRGLAQRTIYRKRLQFFRDSLEAIVRVQVISLMHTHLSLSRVRTPFSSVLQPLSQVLQPTSPVYFNPPPQAAWKGLCARRQYKNLVKVCRVSGTWERVHQGRAFD